MSLSDRPPEVDGYEWVNTPGYDDYAVAGKPLHAVNLTTGRSLCGLWRKAWSFDLFNYAMCIRCLRKLKIECPVCKGTGSQNRSCCTGCYGKQVRRSG